MTRKALILGNGPCAGRSARGLQAAGVEVVLAAAGDVKEAALLYGPDPGLGNGMEVMQHAKLLACRGSVGEFRVTLNVAGTRIERCVDRIIIAEEITTVSNFDLYGLKACEHAWTISRVVGNLEESGETARILSAAKRVVFLSGLKTDSNPVMADTIMRACLKLQKTYSLQTYLFTGNLKVAGQGLEALYRETKAAGTVFVKFEEKLPEISQDRQGRVSLAFFDDVTRQHFQLTPDVTVVDETFTLPVHLRSMAKTLEIECSSDGFLQTDNVHRLSVFTNRKGILVAGPARSLQFQADHLIDADNAVMAAVGLRDQVPADTSDKAEIIQSGCVKCLTCYRLCPYRAISVINSRVTVQAQACQYCGICAAECPRSTINIKDLAPADVADALSSCRPPHSPVDQGFVPSIVAFCCSRSAAPARQLAACLGYDLAQGLSLIEVPCSGSVSLQHILIAFQHQADGVLILTCHEGNCHSENGNTLARQRVDQLREILPQIGLSPERLLGKTLASNMSREFADVINNFERNIRNMGPII